MPKRYVPAGLTPVPNAVQVMSSANSTAVAINSTCRKADVLLISVETTSARFRFDSTAPTKTTGVLIPAGLAPFWFEGYNGTSALKFMRSTSTGSAKITIQGFTHQGDRSNSGR
jgi:hypothetical protein